MIAPSSGSAPGGNPSRARPSRSATCARAKKRSVPSSKTAVTCEKPLRESERVDASPGMPASDVSIGTVTCFST